MNKCDGNCAECRFACDSEEKTEQKDEQENGEE